MNNPIFRLIITIVSIAGFSVTFAATTAEKFQKIPEASPEVFQIKLKYSNVFLIKADQPILIDSGAPGDLPALEAALSQHNLKVEDLKLIVLTHGHADHAGGVVELRKKTKAQVALGKPDVVITRAGKNDELKPTSFMARLVKIFVDFPFSPFEPDILIDEPLDLAPWGIKGHVSILPGHTEGSVVVMLDDKRAFVGDMMLGGIMGGKFFSDQAGEHYFQPDLEKNKKNIQSLIGLGVTTFYLGHGGPVSRESVIKGFNLEMK